jgi:hypothetical protein
MDEGQELTKRDEPMTFKVREGERRMFKHRISHVGAVLEPAQDYE